MEIIIVAVAVLAVAAYFILRRSKDIPESVVKTEQNTPAPVAEPAPSSVDAVTVSNDAKPVETQSDTITFVPPVTTAVKETNVFDLNNDGKVNLADAKEAVKLTSLINKCGLGLINAIPFAPEPVISYAGFTVPPAQFTPSYAGWYVYIPTVSGFIKSKMVIPVVATKDGGGCFDIYDSANPQDKTKYLHTSPTSGNFSSDNLTNTY
jgi:hypothetical protein